MNTDTAGKPKRLLIEVDESELSKLEEYIVFADVSGHETKVRAIYGEINEHRRQIGEAYKKLDKIYKDRE